MDIGSWLRALGLGQYEQAFRDNAVDAEVLPELTGDDLKPNLDSERRGPGSRPLRSLCFPGWRAASRENVVPRPAA